MQGTQHLKEKRIKNKLSQESTAEFAGISREYLSRIENGSAKPSSQLLETIESVIEGCQPENLPEIILDYVRIRFPTKDIDKVLENIMKLKKEYMLYEEYGFYGYSEQYKLGDITLMNSPKEEYGILLELKGKGCRQFEQYLIAQERSWKDFFHQVNNEGGIYKRIDIAINDKHGFLNVAEMIEKCDRKAYSSLFRNYKVCRSGELCRKREQHQNEMGSTLYLGSTKSELHFCIYQKDYEQYQKLKKNIEDAEVKNRFELRFREKRAEKMIQELLDCRDAGNPIVTVIDKYIQFNDNSSEKIDRRWNWFIQCLKKDLPLSMKPEPYTMEKTIKWMERQVAPTLKTLMVVDEIEGTNFVGNMIRNTKLKHEHKKIIEQQIIAIEDMIVKE